MVDLEPKDIWLMRPCETYKEEYTDCKAFLSRFYQNYIYGQKSDCTNWLTDYNNCMKYRNRKDPQAAGQYDICGYVDSDARQRRKSQAYMTMFTFELGDQREEVIQSERERRKLRLRNANSNDVWEYRTSPPAEWFTPLNSEENSNR